MSGNFFNQFVSKISKEEALETLVFTKLQGYLRTLGSYHEQKGPFATQKQF